jgi:hypothetical protein
MQFRSTKLLPLLLLCLTGATFCAAQSDPDPNIPSAPVPQTYRPLDASTRLAWIARSTVGWESLAAGAFTAGIGTAENRPKDYGTHWEGYGKRYGIRLSGVATSNTIEAELGGFWGEDPRYFRAGPNAPFKKRLQRAVYETFYARHPDGVYKLAAARLIAIPSSNFISNSWRADSEANVHDALFRTALGFAGHMTRNMWEEFKVRK